MSRVFLIVLDSLGIGALPDAAAFGDAGSNTLKAVCASPDCKLPTLTRLGLFDLTGTPDIPHAAPQARVARMAQRSAGKDTIIGHWEIAGLTSQCPLPTYPRGFPASVMDAFCAAVGRGYLCNEPYSGTQVLLDYGAEHEKSQKFIVYTSADSVFQIAAHESVIPLPELYAACESARTILCGEHSVGRVIARPFTGAYPRYTRTKNRHDYSLPPPGLTMLDILCAAGKDVLAVGKISDIFASRGITHRFPSASNAQGMAQIDRISAIEFDGLCFANLVDFDMLYGHRNDRDGYAKALTEFDTWLNNFLPRLSPDDLLILTADHGCDPSTPSTDHSREYTPCLIYGASLSPQNLGTRETFGDIGATVLARFSLAPLAGTASMI